jgi:hypothetical protein
MADRSPPTAAAFSSFSVGKRIVDKFARRRRISGREEFAQSPLAFQEFLHILRRF